MVDLRKDMWDAGQNTHGKPFTPSGEQTPRGMRSFTANPYVASDYVAMHHLGLDNLGMFAEGFASENVFVAGAEALMRVARERGDFIPIPGFKVTPDLIRGYEDFATELGGARSQAELNYRMEGFQTQVRRRQALAIGSGFATFGAVIGGLANPDTFVPGSKVLKFGRAATVLTNTELGVLTGSLVGIEEAVWHEASPDRSWQQSILNVATAGVAASVIGAVVDRVRFGAGDINKMATAYRNEFEGAEPPTIKPGVLTP